MQQLILPSEALSSFKALIDIDAEETKETFDRFHSFMIGNIGMLIDDTQFCEIIDNSNICKIPLTPQWFKGILNLRGNSVPIVNLNEYYGIKASSPKRNRKHHILAIGKGRNLCGIEIPNLPSKISLEKSDIINRKVSLPKNMDEQIECIYEHNGIWVKIDTNIYFNHLFSPFH